MGCNLVNEAASASRTCILGCDPFVNGFIKLVEANNKTGLDNIFFLNLDFYTFAEYLKNKDQNFFHFITGPLAKK